jgi:glyoxylase-like metal-dependent hydrolase (beta-lactamase superfamily II)
MSRRIAVGSGSLEGTNSAYLLAERGVVVDPGPPDERAWSDLRAGLADAGVELADVERVVVTHWHVDHAGLAPRLAEAAGATIHMHERDAPFVRTYEDTRDRRLERDADRMALWGVPDAIREETLSADTPSPLPEETTVIGHTDGETVADATVWHTPGHTEGHLALVTGDEAFVGDAVLSTYTPNVGGSDTRADDPLPAYAEGLERLASATKTLRPGHGTAVDPNRIEAIRAHHRERSQNVLAAVDEIGPASPWTVARRLFGEMDGVHAKFGAGEAAAHLRWLAAAGAVSPVSESPRRYESTAAGWPAAAFPL